MKPEKGGIYFIDDPETSRPQDQSITTGGNLANVTGLPSMQLNRFQRRAIAAMQRTKNKSKNKRRK